MESTTVDESVSQQGLEQSESFIGQWNKLISTTNWEKGEIICTWRKTLRESSELAATWSDEKWSQLVGGVTPQHVGRLRRTSERFGLTYPDYKRLFWSHFYAALDWDDAEMWLEGAVQNKWSVSQMRKKRWETLGKLPSEEPLESDIVTAEIVEETQSLALSDSVRNNEREFIEGPLHEGPDFGDEQPSATGKRKNEEALDLQSPQSANSQGIRPFESFTNLPEDVSQAANLFKIAIINHRANEWAGISPSDMLSLFDALKQLVGVDLEVATQE